MWSKELFSTHMDIWGTIPAGMLFGTISPRYITFYRDVYIEEIQVTLGWSGAIPVVQYTWNVVTNLTLAQGSAFEILPAGSPFTDKSLIVWVSSGRVNHVRIEQAIAANESFTFDGGLYAHGPVAPLMSCAMRVDLFYKVKRFL